MDYKLNKGIMIRIQAPNEEFDYLIKILGNISFYNKYGYDVSIPNHQIFKGIEVVKDTKVLDIGKLRNIFENEIYDADTLEYGINIIADNVEIIERTLNRMRPWSDWGFNILPQYQILLTAYGPGACYWYNSNKGNVLMKIKPNGTFSGQDPIYTIVHEIVHMGIEESIVKKFGITHIEKESIVDSICMNCLGDILTDYKIQKLCDMTVVNLISKENIQNLPKIIESYKTKNTI